MILNLTAEQAAVILPHVQRGRVLIGRILRQPFDGSNAETSGKLALECGNVPEASLPELRAVIRQALNPTAKAKRKQKRPSHEATMNPACTRPNE